MSAQRLLPIISIAIVLVLGGLWIAFSGEAGDAMLAPGLGASENPAAPTPAGLEKLAPEALSPDSPQIEGPRSDLSSEETAALDDQRLASFDTADARWLEVEVQQTGSRKADESMHVLALAADGEHEDELRSLCGRLAPQRVWALQRKRLAAQSGVDWTRRVVENGRARIPLPPGTARAGFLLDGRFLYLERPLEIPISDETGHVLLEPSVGAFVHLTYDLPAAAAARGVSADTVAGEISLAGSWMFRRGARSAPVEYELDAAEATSFDLRAVPPETLLNIFGSIEGLAPFQELGLSFEPDEERTIEIQFAMGGEISGRVFDPSGDPIDDAQVSTADRSPMAFMGGAQATTTETDSQGHFRLLGTPTGSVQLEVLATNWLPKTTDEVEIAEGQTLNNLEIALDQGQRISGRVLFPGGQPAADAQLKIQAEGGGRGPWQGQAEPIESTTDENGRFTIWGLPEGTVDLTARLGRAPKRPAQWRPRALDDDDSDAGEDDSESIEESTGWRARANDIETGTENIELVLFELVAIRGRVHDDLGQPIPDFHLSALPEDQAATPWARGERIEQSVEASLDGSFELWGLGTGDWTIKVRAEDHASSDGSETAISVPYSGPDLELVLARAASLTGIVLDPLGQPARATVIASDGENAAWWSGGGQRTQTEADGTFVMEGVALGTLALRAESDDWASSEPINVELAAAQTVTDLSLVLRVGGRLTGEIFDAQGEPSAGRQVSISENAMGGGMFGNGPATSTDSAGFFALDHLTPGTWVVSAGPSDAEKLEIMASSEGQSGFMKMFSETDTASVEIIDGEETHITLGADPIVPVRVFGRVTQAGDAVPEAQVIAMAEGGSLLKGMKMANSDEAGSFELTVDRPGAYMLTVQRDGRGSQIRFPVDVPEQEEFSLDLSLPAGRIEGTVHDPDGAPVARVQVSAQSDAEPQFMDGSGGVRTDSDGHFEFTGLWAGTYTVRAGAAAGGRFFGGNGESRFGTTIVSGIDVDTDATTRGVDITLASASKVAGTVRDQNGELVSGASIFVRDEQGRLLSAISGTVTNAAGEFEYAGVPPGMVTVSARSEDGASPTSAPLRTDPAEAAEVELTLESGTMLTVQVVDEEGEALRGTVRVFDENDNEVGSMMTIAGFQEMFTEGFSSSETKIGPLPAGKYLVEASDNEGRRTRKPVTLKGQESRRLKLRLKD